MISFCKVHFIVTLCSRWSAWACKILHTIYNVCMVTIYRKYTRKYTKVDFAERSADATLGSAILKLNPKQYLN